MGKAGQIMVFRWVPVDSEADLTAGVSLNLRGLLQQHGSYRMVADLLLLLACLSKIMHPLPDPGPKRGQAWAYAMAVVALAALNTTLLVRISYAQRDFSTAMSGKDEGQRWMDEQVDHVPFPGVTLAGN